MANPEVFPKSTLKTIKSLIKKANNLAADDVFNFIKNLCKSQPIIRGNTLFILNPCRRDKSYGSFVINKKTGQWKDFALSNVGGSDWVSLCAYTQNVRQTEAAQKILTFYNFKNHP